MNTAVIGGQTYKYFRGTSRRYVLLRCTRFFQVRAFLAARFGAGDTTASLPLTCDGKALGAGNDVVGLFNPPTCASDFTKNYNVNQIALQTPIAALQANGETAFDTWSTISVPQ